MILDFSYSKEQIDETIKWLEAGQILDEAGGKIPNAVLTRNNKF